LRSKHPDEVDLKPHSEDDISKMIEKLETKAKKEELNRIREERKNVDQNQIFQDSGTLLFLVGCRNLNTLPLYLEKALAWE
jgi:Zn-dependent M16 (insulinase) family peptidase